MSASKQAPPTTMRASSRNHNHTRTALQGRAAPPHSRLNTHISHPTQNNNIAHRLDMQAPPTPPAEDISKRGAPLNGGGAGEQPTTPGTNHHSGPAKFGASPSAPSFASVVSSSTTSRCSARSPLSTTHDSSPLQPHHQKQEQAQTQAQSSAAHSQTSLEHPSATTIDEDGSHTIADNLSTEPAIAGDVTEAHSQCVQSSSPKGRPPHGSPAIPKANDTEAGEDQNQENELEDSESSDVEIYLNTLGLHDSAARMHVFGGPGDTYATPIRANSITLTQPSNEYSVISSSMQFGGEFAVRNANSNATANAARLGGADLNNTNSLSPLSFALRSSNGSPSSSSHLRSHQPQQYSANSAIGSAKSPQLPNAPVHGTIPLPHIDEKDYLRDADARQLHNLQQHQNQQQNQQQQQTHTHPSPGVPSNVHNNDTIDLTGLTIGAAVGGDAVRGQRQQQLGLPTSHSQPMLSVDTPGSSNGYDSMGLGPVSGFPTSMSDSALGGAGQKTPNVYINGLPPHFREDQLFDLTCPFGAIRSVRTFTRHVRDSESGYGFVLFETIEAAERCIISLRRYRNLHPTFSKQIHKIPGTTYAQGAVAPSSTATIWNEQGLDSDSGSNVGSNADSLGQEASFKAKMENLQDPTSTNLYMEGLPLSLDEATLAALVAPHVISSSRFFHTRLSNPPRIIAFVRLETRKGAEEIIERLHGRMVRGWNDTGSRISVRFADTAEQRELRRMERSAQEGDTSPARLTIAQAALLNLRGKELGPSNSSPAGSAGRLPPATSRGFSTSISAPDFASNTHLAPELEVDYSLAPGRGSVANARSRSPYQTQHGLGYQQPDPYASAHSQHGYGLGHSPTPPMDPAMAALINSLGNTNLSNQGGPVGYGDNAQAGGDVDYMQAQQRGPGNMQQHPPIGHHHLQTSLSADNIHQYARPAPAYTRSGYTPTEEYIMRAHAESAALAHAQVQAQQVERRRPAPLDLRRRRVDESEFAPANIAVGVRGYRAQASVGRLGQGFMSPSTPIGTLPSPTSMGGMGAMAEDDFHASMRNDFGRALNSNTGDGDLNRTVNSAAHTRLNPNIHPAHVNARLSRDHPPASAPSTVTNYSQMQRSPLPLSPLLPPALQSNSGSNQESPNLSQAISYHHAAAHMRSTTLPQHRTSSARDGQQQLASGRGHYQHSSMSMPAQNLRTPQHASVAVFGGAGGIDGGAGSGTIYEDGSMEDDHQQQRSSESRGGGTNVIGSNAPNSSKPSTQNIFGDMESSSSTGSLISPTLTYGTQTPSTLSPATPFFGSFSSQGEGFDKGINAAGIEGQHQKKQTNGSSAVASTPLRS